MNINIFLGVFAVILRNSCGSPTKCFSESGSCSKTEFTGTHITGDFAKIHTKVSWDMECSIDGKPGR